LPQPVKPSPAVALLRVSAPAFTMACFTVLAVIGLARRDWFGWLFLALALLYATRVVVRLRRMCR
jgi:fatty acid desaturase